MCAYHACAVELLRYCIMFTGVWPLTPGKTCDWGMALGLNHNAHWEYKCIQDSQCKATRNDRSYKGAWPLTLGEHARSAWQYKDTDNHPSSLEPYISSHDRVQLIEITLTHNVGSLNLDLLTKCLWRSSKDGHLACACSHCRLKTLQVRCQDRIGNTTVPFNTLKDFLVIWHLHILKRNWKAYTLSQLQQNYATDSSRQQTLKNIIIRCNNLPLLQPSEGRLHSFLCWPHRNQLKMIGIIMCFQHKVRCWEKWSTIEQAKQCHLLFLFFPVCVILIEFSRSENLL